MQLQQGSKANFVMRFCSEFKSKLRGEINQPLNILDFIRDDREWFSFHGFYYQVLLIPLLYSVRCLVVLLSMLSSSSWSKNQRYQRFLWMDTHYCNEILALLHMRTIHLQFPIVLYVTFCVKIANSPSHSLCLGISYFLLVFQGDVTTKELSLKPRIWELYLFRKKPQAQEPAFQNCGIAASSNKGEKPPENLSVIYPYLYFQKQVAQSWRSGETFRRNIALKIIWWSRV